MTTPPPTDVGFIFDGLRSVVDTAEEAARMIVSTQAAEIERLRALLAPDDGSLIPHGRIVVGCATTGGNLARIEAHEAATGMPCAFRQYAQPGNTPTTGIAAFRPGGPLVQKAARDVAAGRVPVISGKPGIAALAQRRYGPELVAHFRALGEIDGLIVEAVHHEPENDGLDPALFRASQQWVRECLDESEVTNVMFVGSLMTYTWTAQGRKDLGDPESYLVGPDVWDACGLDHYTPRPADPIISAKLTDALASLKARGLRPAITELGVRPEDTRGGAKIIEAFDLMLEHDGALFLYYDSKTNSTGSGWEMAGTTLQEFRSCLTDPAAYHPNRRA